MAILSCTYILLKDKIDPIFNSPTFTEEELAVIGKRTNPKAALAKKDDWNRVKNGIHVNTGLKADKNVNLIIGACTSCHSAKLITQNRATRKGWKNMIVWMQETQGLTDLGSNEPFILDYLAKYYAPSEIGRRANLDIKEVEWYILNLDENVTE